MANRQEALEQQNKTEQAEKRQAAKPRSLSENGKHPVGLPPIPPRRASGTGEGSSKTAKEHAMPPPTTDIPFVCNTAQIKEGTQRAEELLGAGLMPKEVVYMQFACIFTTSSYLKMHDKIILIGPFLKYLLQGYFGVQERKALFRLVINF